MPLNIVSSDVQIADILVHLKSKKETDGMPAFERGHYECLTQRLDEILARQQRGDRNHGGKGIMTPDEYQEIQGMVNELYPVHRAEAGGSSGNTLTTLKRLLGDCISAKIITVIGEHGEYDHLIRDSLYSAGVEVISPPEGAVPHESATSFVFEEPGNSGDRTILSYHGNMKQMIDSKFVLDEYLRNADVAFIQGSMWKKLLPEVANSMMEKRWNYNKELWLALPTQSEFDDYASPDHYRFIIPSADMVLGNADELMRVYEIKPPKLNIPKNASDDEKQRIEEEYYQHIRPPFVSQAVEKLKEELSKRDGILQKRGIKRSRPPVAMITDDVRGAEVVTGGFEGKPGETEHVDATKVEGTLHKLGAGDNAFAGFEAGHIAHMPPAECAELGMNLAGAKLKYDGARIPDPRAALENYSPRAKALLAKMDEGLARQEQHEQEERSKKWADLQRPDPRVFRAGHSNGGTHLNGHVHHSHATSRIFPDGGTPVRSK